MSPIVFQLFWTNTRSVNAISGFLNIGPVTHHVNAAGALVARNPSALRKLLINVRRIDDSESKTHLVPVAALSLTQRNPQ
jgi:hypothetical protein